MTLVASLLPERLGGSKRAGADHAGMGSVSGEKKLYPALFPGGSDGKESACNAGDQGSIPGSGRSPG